MPEAHQVRGYERQRLIEKLLGEVYNHNDDGESDFLFSLVIVMMRYLKYLNQHKSQGGRSTILDITNETDVEIGLYFLNTLLPDIEKFIRVPEEEPVLLIDLMKKIADSACMRFITALMRRESTDPKSVFKADSAIATVPFNP